MKTWHYEAAVALSILLLPTLILGGTLVGYVGVFAVFMGFLHGQVASRSSERDADKASQGSTDVLPCHRKEMIYFLLKEVGWFVYFVMLQAWPALIGVGLFLIYRVWRKWYRQHYPLNRGV